MQTTSPPFYVPSDAGLTPRIKLALNWSFIYPQAPFSPFVSQTPETMLVAPLEGYGDWLEDERSIRLLQLIDSLCGDSTRRYGSGIPEMAHLLWVANWNYNSRKVRQILDEAGIDPVVAALAGLLHDSFEAMLANARKSKVILSVENIGRIKQETLEKIFACLPHPDDRRIIRAVDHDYMTDVDPNKRGKDRIEAQQNAPIDPTGDSVIRILNLTTRAGDKTHNVQMDAYMRECYVEACKSGSILPHASLEEKRCYGLPDEDVEEAVRQAWMKRYAVERGGIPEQVKQSYCLAAFYLRTEEKRINPPGIMPSPIEPVLLSPRICADRLLLT